MRIESILTVCKKAAVQVIQIAPTIRRLMQRIRIPDFCNAHCKYSSIFKRRRSGSEAPKKRERSREPGTQRRRSGSAAPKLWELSVEETGAQRRRSGSVAPKKRERSAKKAGAQQQKSGSAAPKMCECNEFGFNQ